MDKSINNSPLVSVIMPTHNAGRYIRASIESVLAQTYPKFELLIIDDASTDDTKNIVGTFKDVRIRYLPVERIGSPAGVRNVGFREAQGDMIAFLDSDDLYYPDTLERLLGYLSKNSRLGAVYGFASHMDENDRPLRNGIELVQKADNNYEIPESYTISWKKLAQGHVSCLLPALMMRRSTLEAVGYFNEALCGPEDFEFYLRLHLHDFDGIRPVPEYIYRYRIHSASLTKAPEHWEKLLNSNLKIMDWLFALPQLSAEARGCSKSEALTEFYRYLARERLVHHQPGLARSLAIKALKNPEIHGKDWAIHCFPLVIRSFIPTWFDSFLITIKWKLRQGYNRLCKQVVQI